MSDFWDGYFQYLILYITFVYSSGIYYLSKANEDLPKDHISKLGKVIYGFMIFVVISVLFYILKIGFINHERLIDLRYISLIAIMLSLIPLAETRKSNKLMEFISINNQVLIIIFLVLISKALFITIEINTENLTKEELKMENFIMITSLSLSFGSLILYLISKFIKK